MMEITQRERLMYLWVTQLMIEDPDVVKVNDPLVLMVKLQEEWLKDTQAAFKYLREQMKKTKAEVKGETNG